MNRLILIGNGFDLAHGLKTSYLSFIIDLFSNSIRDKRNTGDSNALFDIDLDILLKLSAEYGDLSIRDTDLIKLTQTLIDRGEILKILIKPSDFVVDIVSSVSNNRWVDLEYVFFKNIMRCSSMNIDQPLNIPNNRINALNEQWDFLKKSLANYLKSNNSTDYVEYQYKDYFYEKFRNLVNMNPDKNGLSDNIQIMNHYFINFNYTNTYKTYVNLNDIERCIDIHGLLSKHNQDLIFGWGDDTHPLYKQIEALNDNRYLKHTKSFGYLQNNKYKSLMSIISESPYEVYIFGHSCGLSDRTMLESIFNSPKCIQIKIFYHETSKGNDYFSKAIEISRHCPDKVGLRSKIVSFDDSVCMPNFSIG